MSNEYNNEIRQMVAYSHMNRFGELDEVYRKAKAFDAYHGTIQSHLHLKGEPEFSNPATEVLSDLIDIHDDYENKGDK